MTDPNAPHRGRGAASSCSLGGNRSGLRREALASRRRVRSGAWGKFSEGGGDPYPPLVLREASHSLAAIVEDADATPAALASRTRPG